MYKRHRNFSEEPSLGSISKGIFELKLFPSLRQRTEFRRGGDSRNLLSPRIHKGKIRTVTFAPKQIPFGGRENLKIYQNSEPMRRMLGQCHLAVLRQQAEFQGGGEPGNLLSPRAYEVDPDGHRLHSEYH